MSPLHSSGALDTPRRRRAGPRSGPALLAAFASTLRILRGLLFVLAALYLCSGVTRVGPHEDALVYRFGRLLPEVHPPGLLLALPSPIDRVVRVPTRTQQEVFLIDWSPEEDAPILSNAIINATAGDPRPTTSASIAGTIVTATAPADIAALTTPPAPTDKGLHPVFDGYTLTGDANLVQARLTVRYRIVDPIAHASHVHEGAFAPLLASIVYRATTHALAGMRIDDALGAGLGALRDQVRPLAQASLDALRLGVELVAFEISALTPPQATVAAFADVTSAQVESRTTLEKARTYQAQILPKARADAFRLRKQADADARQLTLRATAEASSFTALAEAHAASPWLLETRLRADTLETVLGQVKTTTVLPDAAGGVDVFFPAPR